MIPEPKFLRRFEQIRSSLRRYQGGLGLATTILAAATALGVLAWLDYRYELTRPTRVGGLVVASLMTLGVLGRWLVAPLRWWTQPRTAAEIEGRFPELGQRIRTVVQYAGQPAERMTAGGVKPSLVTALAVETDERATPLPLDRVVRWRRVQVVATLAAIVAGMLALAASRNPEWRIALGRAVLIERPYTTVVVKPGDVLVDQGKDIPVVAAVIGRQRRSAVLQTRPLGQKDAAWRSERLTDRFTAVVQRVKEPVEYRVVAGPAASLPHTIQVRYPLALRSIDVEVRAPAYTGLDPKTVRGGDVQAVEGSVATFKVAFDGVPSTAALELVAPTKRAAKPGEPDPTPTVLPLRREGDTLVATLDLKQDLDYQIVARTVDGRILPKNKHRIDVVEDRAPRVAFDEPDEALEVHPIAEVRHRARIADDFGITKAGIVYRFNDGDEKTLILKDFPLVPGQKPKPAATLEEVLLTEILNATPQDSVTYYAFAEDNYPGEPRRTETDLRYIDFRSFKREYKLSEGGAGDGEPLDLIALDELIARQRVNLNRAHRMAKRRPNDRTEADDPIKVAGVEEALLALTKEFTEGIEQLADQRVDALHRALDAMQAAIDALDRSRLAEVPPAMAEALKHLVAARRDLLFLIGNNKALAKAMQAFDRRQAQKIRKPKSKDEEAQEIADRLEELAQDEDIVYATIAASMDKGDSPDPSPAETPAGQSAEPKAAPKQGAEPKDAARKEGATKGEGPPDEGEGGAAEPKKLDRRAVAEKQEQITDEVRNLEEKLKQLEVASDLAKARMARAAEKVDQAAGALNRGNAREAAADSRAGAGMLHELARQVKGEITAEATDELAMARDLAAELARREAEFAERTARPTPGTQPGPGPKGKDGPGQDGEAQAGQAKNGQAQQGQGEGSGDQPGNKPGTQPGQGGGGTGGWGSLTEAEQVDRMAEMARTLEAWLKQVDRRGEGKAADAVRELLDAGNVAEVVERAGQMGELRAGGKRPELSREARELATKLEVIGQALERLHRGIVAPEMAALVEFDRRLAELTTQLATLKTEAEVEAWKRAVATLVLDLNKAGIAGADDLADAITGGGWHWDPDHRHFLASDAATTTLRTITCQIKDRIQDLILKDLAAARDEATPPLFRELVERYYEVISQGARPK